MAAGLLGALMAQPENVLAISRTHLENAGNLQAAYKLSGQQSVSLPCMSLQQRDEIQAETNAMTHGLHVMQNMLNNVIQSCRKKESIINKAIETISDSEERFSFHLWSDEREEREINKYLKKILYNIEDSKKDNKSEVDDFFFKEKIWVLKLKNMKKTWERKKNTPDGKFMLSNNEIVTSEITKSSQCLRDALNAQDDLKLAAESLLALLHLPVESSVISSAQEIDAALDALWA